MTKKNTNLEIVNNPHAQMRRTDKEQVQVGGMNHFLLPGSTGGKDYESARFGAFSMEKLINEIIKLGGQKNRLEVKVFGGGNVIKSSTMIGSRNVQFIHEFLRNENLKIVSEDVEGNYPRRVHYFPETGKTMLRKLKRKDDVAIVEEEKNYAKKVEKEAKGSDVELF